LSLSPPLLPSLLPHSTMAPSTSLSPHTEPFSIRKRRYFFRNFLDIDRDGLVRWKDLEELMVSVTTLARKDELIRSKMALIGLWHDLTDDKMTEGDWLEMWNERKEDKDENSMVDHVFTLLDPSGDGLIDESEYVHVLSFFGKSKQEALRCFDSIGRTPSGEPVFAIDSKRFVSLWNEFFYSEDPSCDGSHLFGLIEFSK
ncbi:hypothetical protein PFISCL1PPCAC_8158, partial [Pristionchus fissidentatus]